MPKHVDSDMLSPKQPLERFIRRIVDYCLIRGRIKIDLSLRINIPNR
jgi:hypothetical protein